MASKFTPEPDQPANRPDNDSSTIYVYISLVVGIFAWFIAFLLMNLNQSLGHNTLLSILSDGLFVVGPLVTVVFGHLGLRKDQKQRGAAVTGLILGYLELIVVILTVYLVIVLYAGGG